MEAVQKLPAADQVTDVEEEEEEVAAEEEGSLKRRSTTTTITAPAPTTSENGSSSIRTAASSGSFSGESASWVTTGDYPEVVDTAAASNKDIIVGVGPIITEEETNGGVSFNNIKNKNEAEAESEVEEIIIPQRRGGSTEIDWTKFNVKREELAAKFKDIDIELLISSAFGGESIENKQIEYREGTSSEEIRLNEGETVIYEAEESDEEVVELEFEKAVEKFHTHDDYNMFCPNCSSRVTRLVLRRKIRQRRILVASSDKERRDLFGCLACFRVFIAAGNKLNPFRIFGAGRGPDQDLQLQEELPTSEPAVPTPPDIPVRAPDSTQAEERGFDLFWFFKKRRVDGSSLTSPLIPAEDSTTAVTTTTTITRIPSKPRDEDTEQAPKAQIEDIQLPQVQADFPQAKEKGFDLFWFIRKRRVDENALTAPLIPAAAQVQSSFDTFTSTAPGLQRSTTTVTSKPRKEAIKQEDAAIPLEKDENTTKIVADDGVISTAVKDLTTVRKTELVADAVTVEKVSQIPPPKQDASVIIDVYEKLEGFFQGAETPLQPQLEVKGDYLPEGDVRIPVVETPPVGTGIIPELASVAAATITTEIVTELGTPRSVDVLKSIVYGGLMESIISLVVVSLATASNATTINVVAIGLACLVGGLILLIHNLRVLRYGHPSQTTEQSYQEQLGRKELFPLHVTVAVVSYVVFGLIPPGIFGFTFRETNDWELKMAAVAGASFLCIVILAIALAYVRGEQGFVAYFKTVLYYVVLAAIATAAAFAIAFLIKDPFPCPAVLDSKEM